MKRIGTGKIFAGLLGLLVAVVVGIAYFPSTAYAPPTRDLRDESSFRLNEKVGWYRLEDRSTRLLTWGAENGLVMYGFGSERDALKHTRFSPTSRNSFVAASPASISRLEFPDSEDGTVTEARLTDDEGETRILVRVSDVGYETREVRFNNGPIELSGLLFVPDGAGPHPAVAFIHGSGESDRDSFWYLSPADYLARQGITVLLPDKRGCGKSGGEWHTASFHDFADDALAAIAFLGQQSGVDRSRVGLTGFSQGGWIAPLAASRSRDVAFVVTVSGSAATPAEELTYEIRQEIAGSGTPGIIADMVAPIFARRARMARRL